MTDLTLKEFCKQFDACHVGYEYGYSLTAKKGEALMSEIWKLMDNRTYMLWVISREDVLTPQERVSFAVRCIRETPAKNGKTVYDLLIDERSLKAVLVCEQFIAGSATYDDVKDASYAAAHAAYAAAHAAYAAAYAAHAAYAAAYAAHASCAAAHAADDSYAAYAAYAKQIKILKSIPNPFKARAE